MKIFKYLTIAIAFLGTPGGIHIAMAQQEPIHAKGYAVMDNHSKLVPYNFDRRPVGNRDILVKILYCGICHSDIHEAANDWNYTSYPNVPGHEMVGKVIQIGKDVTRFRKDDYIGVGGTVTSCGECEMCKSGKEQLCTAPPVPHADYPILLGGYSNKIVVDERYGIHIPEGAPIERIGPLMCAGITTYSPLKATVKKGDKVAIAGFGGLGHMGVQFAVALGADVIVFDIAEDKREMALEFGAKKYVNVSHPEELSGVTERFDYILTTIPTGYDLNPYLNLLKPEGELLIVGLPALKDAFMIDVHSMPFGTRISKWLMGGIKETQEMVDFSIEHHILPEVKVIPVQQVNEAFQSVKEGKVHFRYVIDMNTLNEE